MDNTSKATASGANYAFSTDYSTSNSASTPSASMTSSTEREPGLLSTSVATSPGKIEDTIERVATWFLGHSAMSHKKLQKLCYYAYAWYIVFANDLEAVELHFSNINTLTSNKFQAWIHGPVNPLLYHKYKKYGWADIPQEIVPLSFPQPVTDLLEQVWGVYGKFSADELEAISHSEFPWQNARGNLAPSDSCANVIDDRDILRYYSALR